jgi:hypothetical protein
MNCPLTEASQSQNSGDQKTSQFAYCERVFLHPPTTGKNSYICAIAESSEGGVYKAGDYVLIVADCHHAIELEFSLINPKEREESLAKIEVLVEIVSRFREALHSEAKAIESIEQ